MPLMMFLLLCVADAQMLLSALRKEKGGQLTALILTKTHRSGFFLLAAIQATFFQDHGWIESAG
ncbi:hypothetical protein ACLB1R_26595 [Escherichia coli]